MIQRTIGRKLHKSIAVQVTDDSSDETEESKESEDKTVRTEWELLQDIYFKNRFTRARNASQESFLEDEESCELNLSKLYQEGTHQKIDKLPSLEIDPPETVMDVLIKSIEAENSEASEKGLNTHDGPEISLISLE